MACADGIVNPKNEVRSGPPSARETGFNPKRAGEIPGTDVNGQSRLRSIAIQGVVVRGQFERNETYHGSPT